MAINPTIPLNNSNSSISLLAKCAICHGEGVLEFQMDEECPFCNGTGEGNKASESYMKSHICQCAMYDRKQCPLCQKKCHHDTPNRPKLLAGGGMEF